MTPAITNNAAAVAAAQAASLFQAVWSQQPFLLVFVVAVLVQVSAALVFFIMSKVG